MSQQSPSILVEANCSKGDKEKNREPEQRGEKEKNPEPQQQQQQPPMQQQHQPDTPTDETIHALQVLKKLFLQLTVCHLL